MKNKVIKFFQNLPDAPHEQFNKAFELYRQSDGKSAGIERSINAVGYTPASLKNLLYDLQKLHGISDVEKEPVVIPVVKEEIQEPDARIAILGHLVSLLPEEYGGWLEFTTPTNEELDNLLKFAVSVGNDKAVEVLNEIILSSTAVSTEPNTTSTELNPVSTEAGATSTEPNSEIEGKKEGILPEWINPDSFKEEIIALQSENEDLQNDNIDLQDKNEELENVLRQAQDDIEELKSVPKITAQSIRVEFPFLNNPDCPDELKILTADKITVWNRYVEIQDHIAKAVNGEVKENEDTLAILAKEAVEAFAENQKIYDELNAYAATGKVLGNHPIFKKLQLSREVETMTNEELVKYKNSSSKYFSDNKKLLATAEKENKPERVLEIKERVEDRVVKLALVNKKLGIPAK